MPSIQVKNVHEAVHATLRRRAAEAGMSLQEYLLSLLIDDAATPTVDEMLDRIEGERSGGRATLASAVTALRVERDSR